MHTGDDAGKRAEAVGAENFYGEELDLLADSEVPAADDAGNVRSVAILVGWDAVDKVGDVDGTALELLVCGKDTLRESSTSEQCNHPLQVFGMVIKAYSVDDVCGGAITVVGIGAVDVVH